MVLIKPTNDTVIHSLENVHDIRTLTTCRVITPIATARTDPMFISEIQ